MHDHSEEVDPLSMYAVFVSYIEIYNERIIDLGRTPRLCVRWSRAADDAQPGGRAGPSRA